MKSRYTVERELADIIVDKRIKGKCNTESSLNYIRLHEKELINFFEFLLRSGSDEGLDCEEHR